MNDLLTYCTRLPRSEPFPGKPLRRLIENWAFKDQFGRPWTIEAGFVSDGASIPTITGLAWAVIGSKHDPRLGPAAWAHDWFCRKKFSRMRSSDAHELFRLMCIANGVPSWKAAVMHKGILIGGPDW